MSLRSLAHRAGQLSKPTTSTCFTFLTRQLSGGAAEAGGAPSEVLKKIMLSRFATRKFVDKEVPEEVLKSILAMTQVR